MSIDRSRPWIRSSMPAEPGPTRPCCWCGNPTEVMAETPFRPDLGALPVHVVCQLRILTAYERWSAGRLLTEAQQLGMRRLLEAPAP